MTLSCANHAIKSTMKMTGTPAKHAFLFIYFVSKYCMTDKPAT